MLHLTKEEILQNKDHYKQMIKKGSVFIHPTDTIYGVGCSAVNKEAVEKIRNIKKRPGHKPLSIIAPSKEWIIENCYVDEDIKSWLDKLPGPYTLLLKLKNKNAVAENVNPGKESLGIRIPDHWISKAVNEINIPIITASANKAGENYMTSTEDLDPEVRMKIDFLIYEGEKQGKPSTLVNLIDEDIDSSKSRDIIS